MENNPIFLAMFLPDIEDKPISIIAIPPSRPNTESIIVPKLSVVILPNAAHELKINSAADITAKKPAGTFRRGLQ